MRIYLLPLFVLIGLAGRPALADVVVMQNGDRFTGEVSRIWGNDLSIEPDYADEFVLELDKVSYVESDREFDLTLEDGREVKARLEGAGASGTQTVTYDGQTRQVPIVTLNQIVEVDDAFDWESHIDWNSTATTGNTDSTIARVAADTTIEVGDHRHIATLLVADEETAGVKTKDQDFRHLQLQLALLGQMVLGRDRELRDRPDQATRRSYNHRHRSRSRHLELPRPHHGLRVRPRYVGRNAGQRLGVEHDCVLEIPVHATISRV